MIVRMNRRFRAKSRAEHFVGAIGDHLVGVHVRLRAGPGLPDDQREVAVPLALHHFVGSRGNCRGKAWIELAGVSVDLRRRAFNQRQGMDNFDRHALSADREVLQRALRLRAPIAIAGDIDRAEGIAFASNCSLLGRRHRLSL